MNTVVRVLPPGRLASARSYIFCDDEFGSGYMRIPSNGQVYIKDNRPDDQGRGQAARRSQQDDPGPQAEPRRRHLFGSRVIGHISMPDVATPSGTREARICPHLQAA